MSRGRRSKGGAFSRLHFIKARPVNRTAARLLSRGAEDVVKIRPLEPVSGEKRGRIVEGWTDMSRKQKVKALLAIRKASRKETKGDQ
jgi:hypothetical protein